MVVHTVQGRFWAESSFAEKDAVKGAGFWWHGRPGECRQPCGACAAGIPHRHWWTPKKEVAVRLIQAADTEARAALESFSGAVEQSRAAASDLKIPAPAGLEYLPFQRAGVEYALGRSGTLVGDAMGLGKTIQALGVINADPGIRSVLIVCPASLRLNWLREAQRWLCRAFQYHVVEKTEAVPASASLVIVNYDRLLKPEVLESLVARSWDLLVADECFPFETKVITDRGEIEIGRIVREKLSVSVLSCDISRNVLEFRPVVGYSEMPLRERLVRVSFAGGYLDCTERHRVYVEGSGYVPARTLKRGALLRLVRRCVSGTEAREGYSNVLLQKVCYDDAHGGSSSEGVSVGTEACSCDKDVHLVQEGVHVARGKWRCGAATAVLQQTVFGSVASTMSRAEGGIRRACTRNSRTSDIGVQGGCVRADDAVQSNAVSGNAAESVCHTASHRSSSPGAGGQRAHIACAATDVARRARIGVGRRGCCIDAGSGGLRVTASRVQSGSRKSADVRCCRSGRGVARCVESQGAGREEGYVSSLVRVESVTYLEQAGIEGSGECCRGDQSVFDIEVAGNHNFFASGVLVHNCHYLKSRDAKRTQAILGVREKGEDPVPGLIDRAARKIFLTGTPLLNRPIELWPLVSALAPQEFNSFWGFAKRYCAAERTKYGWDFSGSAHLEELQTKLRGTLMIRRTKEQVLTELPAKRRQVIVLPANGAGEDVQAERAAWDAYQDRLAELREEADFAHASGDIQTYEAALKSLTEGVRAAFTEISVARHGVAIAKIPAVVEHVRALLESGVGKVVVFAHHKDVVAGIVQALAEDGARAVTVTGDTDLHARQAAVDAFQLDAGVQLFVGTIGAAGVGITLTASSHVVFAELDWVPANLSQAEDRTHRIGQVHPVLVQHVVLDGSLDARLAEVLVHKQAVIDQALDAETTIPVLPVTQELGVGKDGRVARPKKYPTPTEAVRVAVAQAVRLLAGMCDGAYRKDDCGYNRLDARFGRELAQRSLSRSLTDGETWYAQKVLRKYHRQIPVELYAAAGIKPLEGD